MEYKLIENSLNDLENIKKTIFYNRGIKDIEDFISLKSTCLYSYSKLRNIEDAKNCYLKHLANNSRMHIIVDSDVDGYTSAAMVYSYTKRLNPNIEISYSLHTKKGHGLSNDINVPENINLLIIPDAGSNDYEQCKALFEKGVEIIVLDHHECDIVNDCAIVVNNQICDYPNKYLCGAGIVYKFLQSVDSETWNNFADDYLDLTALALISDNMNVTSLETRYLINAGIKRIRNKFFKALINKQAFSLGERFTGRDIQFLITPLINAMVRAGDSDEKDLMFRAFIERDEYFDYKKRGSEDTIKETVYDRAARLCVNAKSRQNRSKDKGMQDVIDFVKFYKLDENKIIFANVTNILNSNLTGVAAIKVADYFKKPCLLLRKIDDSTFAGSGRNIDDSAIENLKDFLEDTEAFDFVQGHQSAFGVQIKKEKINNAILEINDKLKDADFKTVQVDLIIYADDLSITLIREIDDLKEFFGTGFKEPKLVIENLLVSKEQFSIMGKNEDNFKIATNDNIQIIKFRINEDDELLKALESKEEVYINLIGTANINNYKGILTCQIIISEYEILQAAGENLV